MTDLIHRFKDRDPTQTVSIIKDFFHSYGYTLREEKVVITEANTHWCGISLWFNDKEILSGNGKGSSYEYALASGYSELYERFCAGARTHQVDLLYKYFLNKENIKGRGYFLHPDEKYATFNEIRHSCKKFEKFYDLLGDKNNYFLKTYNLVLPFDTFDAETTSLVVPYQDFISQGNIKYFSKWVIDCFSGSSGLAAGNTIEEALTQGLSECYEHYVGDMIFREPQSQYYELNIENMSIGNYLKDYINGIKSLGYDFYIYDFSYNYGVPVIGGVLVDKKRGVWYLNLGASPVIDIAIERVITEIYQGHEPEIGFSKLNMFPGKDTSHHDAMIASSSAMDMVPFYPEELIFNRVKINSYNTEVFLDNGSYSNATLNEHLRKIGLNNKFNIYYFDLSLCKDMCAVQIFIDNIPLYDTSGFGDILYSSRPILTQIYLEQNYELNYLLMQEMISLIENNKSAENLLVLLNQKEQMRNREFEFKDCYYLPNLILSNHTDELFNLSVASI